jgi:hypothetical protein
LKYHHLATQSTDTHTLPAHSLSIHLLLIVYLLLFIGKNSSGAQVSSRKVQSKVKEAKELLLHTRHQQVADVLLTQPLQRQKAKQQLHLS